MRFADERAIGARTAIPFSLVLTAFGIVAVLTTYGQRISELGG